MPQLSPTDMRKGKKHFSTLSGLTEHLESGACQGGVVTFRKAIKYVEEQLKVFESWQNCRMNKDISSEGGNQLSLEESPVRREVKNSASKSKSYWKGSIRKRMLGGLL